MNKIIFKTLLLVGLGTSLLALDACKKAEDPNLLRSTKRGGCTDIDSPMYDTELDYDDQSCLYAYTKAYTISYYNRNNGADWDDYWCITSQYKPADLILRVKPIGDTDWMFESSVNEDQDYNDSTRWGATAAIKLLNQNYTFELIDEDGAGNWTCDTGSDLIYTGIFNPIENAKDGVVTIKRKVGQDSIQLLIYYDLKQEL